MPFDFNVQVKRLHHRKADNLALFFPYNETLQQCVRSIAGMRFSATHKCWYAENRPTLLSEIFAAFKGVAWVDVTALKQTNEVRAPDPPAAAIVPVVVAPAAEITRPVGERKTPPRIDGALNDLQRQTLRLSLIHI